MQGVSWRENATNAALCATFVLFPSLGIIQKYFRTRGALVYLAIALLLFVAAVRPNAGLHHHWSIVQVCLFQWQEISRIPTRLTRLTRQELTYRQAGIAHCDNVSQA